MSIASELIIWASPFVLGLAAWAVGQVFTDLKDDITYLKNTTAATRTEVAKHSIQISNIDAKLTGVSKSVDDMKKTNHELDKSVESLKTINSNLDKLSIKVDTAEKNYGKILLILHGMASRIGIQLKKSGS